MNTNGLLPARNNAADIKAQAEEMAQALRALKPNANHVKTQLFSMLYPVITELLQKNVTQKAILKLLESKGLKLHPARFKELMTSEAQAQAQANALENFGKESEA